MSRKPALKEHQMAVKLEDFSAYTGFAKRAMAPAAKFNEAVAGNFERLARFQHDLAGDWLQLAIDQMQASAKARDIGSLVSRQAEIASKFVDKATQRQQAFAKLATEAQASVAHWIDEATTAAHKAA
jgi:phasin family protein